MLTGKSFVADNMRREILLPVSQRDVGEDFGGAADDRGVVVDGGVAGDHADVFRAEDVAEGDEFLVGERLDRDGVVGAAALAE
jgi:hypothetical protein